MKLVSSYCIVASVCAHAMDDVHSPNFAIIMTNTSSYMLATWQVFMGIHLRRKGKCSTESVNRELDTW